MISKEQFIKKRNLQTELNNQSEVGANVKEKCKRYKWLKKSLNNLYLMADYGVVVYYEPSILAFFDTGLSSNLSNRDEHMYKCEREIEVNLFISKQNIDRGKYENNIRLIPKAILGLILRDYLDVTENIEYKVFYAFLDYHLDCINDFSVEELVEIRKLKSSSDKLKLNKVLLNKKYYAMIDSLAPQTAILKNNILEIIFPLSKATNTKYLVQIEIKKRDIFDTCSSGIIAFLDEKIFNIADVSRFNEFDYFINDGFKNALMNIMNQKLKTNLIEKIFDNNNEFFKEALIVALYLSGNSMNNSEVIDDFCMNGIHKYNYPSTGDETIMNNIEELYREEFYINEVPKNEILFLLIARNQILQKFN